MIKSKDISYAWRLIFHCIKETIYTTRKYKLYYKEITDEIKTKKNMFWIVSDINVEWSAGLFNAKMQKFLSTIFNSHKVREHIFNVLRTYK